ncbi:MAG: tetratricopeptide repeat protein [Bacteroidales bacterium]|nr:tetratricopeptide repeat protein [Bacteroidales bacterium]
MRIRTYISALLMIMLSQCAVTGQDYHTRSNRALKYYDQGKRDYDLLYYDRAETNLNLAVREDDRFYEAHILLGQLYSDKGDWEKAVTHYRKAVSIDTLFFVPALYGLGRAEFRTGRYTEARTHLEAYNSHPGKPLQN